MALCCRLSFEGQQRRIQTRGIAVPPKIIKEKKNIDKYGNLQYRPNVRIGVVELTSANDC
jgi:hypothetical protein